MANIESSLNHPDPPEDYVPELPIMTVKNRYGYNPNRFWERCTICGFKSAWCETEQRHYPKCQFFKLTEEKK